VRWAAVRTVEDHDVATRDTPARRIRDARRVDRRGAAADPAASLSARLATLIGDVDAARDRYAEAAALAAEHGDRRQEAAIYINLGGLDIVAGDHAAALERTARAAEIFREADDVTGLSVAVINSGWALLGLGDAAAAASACAEGLRIAHRLRFVPRIAQALEPLGDAWIAQGDFELGTELLGAAAALREEVGGELFDSFEEEHHERAVASARSALGDQMFRAVWTRGEALGVDAAVDRGLARL